MSEPTVIQAAMRRKRLTYAALAHELGTSTGYLHDLSSGRRSLTTAMAQRLAPLLGLSAKRLLVAQIEERLR